MRQQNRDEENLSAVTTLCELSLNMWKSILIQNVAALLV
jgi:hypothetical protein